MSNGSPQSNDLISAFHDGELAEQEREAAEQLLEESADSRAELEDYRALSELLRELPAASPLEGLRGDVMRQVERVKSAAPAASPASRPQRRWGVRIAIVASTLTAAAALLVLLASPIREKSGVTVARLDESSTASTADFASAAPVRLNEMSDWGDGAVDSPAVSDALGSAGGITAASSAARPPDGFSVGDVYTYLEQTPEGEVMVVNAVVVDVRRAVDQLQVLLSQSEIPTVSVAMTEEFGRDFRAGAAGRAVPSDAAEQDVALYVESDPGRMNAALSKLGDEENFMSWEYAGVLDETLPQVPQSRTRGAGNARLDEAEAVEAQREPSLEYKAAPSAGVQPQARGSVTDRSFRRAEGANELLPKNPEKSIPLTRQPEPAGLAESDVEKQQRDSNLDMLTNGYQTVLQVPRAALEERLSASNVPAQAEASSRGASRYYFGGAADAQPQKKQAEERLGEQKAQEPSRMRLLGETLEQTQQQRRFRLLVVLEPSPVAAKAVKANAGGQQQVPVEAPLPPGRKKG